MTEPEKTPTLNKLKEFLDTYAREKWPDYASNDAWEYVYDISMLRMSDVVEYLGGVIENFNSIVKDQIASQEEKEHFHILESILLAGDAGRIEAMHIPMKLLGRLSEGGASLLLSVLGQLQARFNLIETRKKQLCFDTGERGWAYDPEKETFFLAIGKASECRGAAAEFAGRLNELLSKKEEVLDKKELLDKKEEVLDKKELLDKKEFFASSRNSLGEELLTIKLDDVPGFAEASKEGAVKVIKVFEEIEKMMHQPSKNKGLSR